MSDFGFKDNEEEENILEFTQKTGYLMYIEILIQKKILIYLV